MADSLLFPWSGDDMSDNTGAAYSGGVFRIYDAGTTNPRTIYSNKELTTPAGVTITTDANGRVPVRYLPVGSWKVTFETAAAVQIFSYDNLPGALDTSPFGTEFARAETPAIVITAASYTALAADAGKLYVLNTSGNDISFSLGGAVSAGDGAVRHVLKSAAANTVTITAPSSQALPRTMTGLGEAMTFVSDGATWHITSHTRGLFDRDLPYFMLKDRLATPPVSPVSGDRYLINGTPTGAWESFALHDIVEYHSAAGYARYAPVRGWKGYLEDENLEVRYTGTTWEDLSNITAPATSALKIAVFEDQKATNTAGGTPAAANRWLPRTINTSIVNMITGVALAGNQITLPVGRYSWHSSSSFFSSSYTRTRVFRVKLSGTCAISNAAPGVVTYAAHGLSANDEVIFATSGALPTGLTVGVSYFVKTVLDANTFTVSATPGGAAINTSSTGSGTHTVVGGIALSYSNNTYVGYTAPVQEGQSHIVSDIEVTGTAITVELQYRVEQATTNALGIAHNNTGFVERYSQILILDRASQQGPQGLAGAAATPGLQTIWIPASAMLPRVTNGAALWITEHATHDGVMAMLDFDQTTEEGCGFSIAFPKGWDEGPVMFQPWWTAASGSGGVVWGLAGVAISNDDAIDVAVSGQQTSTDTLIATGDLHVGPVSSGITIGGTPAEEDLVYFELTREVANVSDTLTADARLIGIKLLYNNTSYADD